MNKMIRNAIIIALFLIGTSSSILIFYNYQTPNFISKEQKSGSNDFLTYHLDYKNKFYNVLYKISNGTLKTMTFSELLERLTINTDSDENGTIYVKFSRNLMDSYTNCIDNRFSVFINERSITDALQSGDENSRILIIPFQRGISEINILSSHPYPKISTMDISSVCNTAQVSPLQQIAHGVLPNNVACPNGLILVEKLSANSVACVNPSSMPNLKKETLAQPVTESNIIIPFGSSDQESHQNFSPVSIKIDNGLHDVVRWINLDNVTNTLVGDPPISSGPILPNQTWALTFYIPGEYHYSSKEHPWMSGTISVWVGRPSYSSVPENITTITLTPGQVMGPIIVKSINHDNVTGIYFPGFDNYAHTFSLQVGQNFTTWWCQGVFVTLEKISDKNATFFVKNTWKSCPICLSSNTLIDTPHGNHDVKELKVGMPVWTLDKSGHKESAIIVKTAKKMVPANSAMIQITLDDGRKLLASPAHPTTDGRLLGEISVGDILDGSPVKRVELLSYNENYTYDILPSGPTGFYWANGILVGSTLN